MTHIIISIVVSMIFIILIGCNNSHLHQAEQHIAQGNFLKALEQLNTQPTDDVHSRHLKALALFVVGKPNHAWRIIDQLDPSDRSETAEILFQAATVIAREKVRYREVIQLVDSCLVFDPKLKDDALNIVWSRGIEYLDVKGDAGYWMLSFFAKHDIQMLKRLRGRVPRETKRFKDMDLAYQQLRRIDNAVVSFRNTHKRLPRTLSELLVDKRNHKSLLYLQGWYFDIRPDATKGYQVVAIAQLRHPAGVVAGTELTYE
jgi:hypothetical protein